jgi:hypothetical protein
MAAVPSADHARLEKAVRAAAGAALDRRRERELSVLSEPLSWLAAGCSEELDILPVLRAIGQRAPPGSVKSWNYFTAAVMGARDRRRTVIEAPGSTQRRTANEGREIIRRGGDRRGAAGRLAAAFRDLAGEPDDAG